MNEEKVDIEDIKVDIGNGKVDIQDKKVDIESVLSEKGSDFSVKTTVHIHRLFEKFGFDEIFGRSAVMDFEILEFVLKYYSQLKFSPTVDVPVRKEATNPKRIQREARKQTAEYSIGTKLQQGKPCSFKEMDIN